MCHFGIKFLEHLQQDNATPHVSSNTLKWFEEKNIAIMKFPRCSPDLNPMENLCAELSRMIYSGNRIFGSREELTGVIIQVSLCKNCNEQKGISIKYTPICFTKGH